MDESRKRTLDYMRKNGKSLEDIADDALRSSDMADIRAIRDHVQWFAADKIRVFYTIDDLLNAEFLSPEFQEMQRGAKEAYANGGEDAVHAYLAQRKV